MLRLIQMSNLAGNIGGAKIIFVPSWSHARTAPGGRGWRYNFHHDQKLLPSILYMVVRERLGAHCKQPRWSSLAPALSSVGIVHV